MTTRHLKDLTVDLTAVLPALTYEPGGEILSVNPAFQTLSGFSAKDLVGEPFENLISIPSASAPSGIESLECRFEGKDGRSRWVRGLFFPPTAEGEAVTMCAVDMTDAVRKANDSKELMDALSRSQAVIEFTPTGEIVHANNNFLSLLGYSLAEIKGRNHSMFVPPDYARSHEYAQFWDDLRAGQFRAGEFCRVAKGGRQIHIIASYNAVLDENGRVDRVVKYASDVTATRVAIEELGLGLSRMEEGDLTVRLSDAVQGDFATVRDSFNTALQSFASVVDRIRLRSESMRDEATDIARGADDMAKRGESQAASLEQTAAAVEEISGNVSMTSQSARECDGAARGAQQVVATGADIVAQAIAAMERIEHHTKKMGEFTRVIESFAFQTNLLSINAAVEAARAGEVGRGFAVVANEVRNLAQQSANASQNIAELISKSDFEVKTGVQLVKDAGRSLEQIREAVSDMAHNIAGIAHATTEQATGVREVSEALSQLDEVNQANLALSNQYASCAGLMSSQIEELTTMLDRFSTEATIAQGAARGHAFDPRRVA